VEWETSEWLYKYKNMKYFVLSFWGYMSVHYGPESCQNLLVLLIT